MNLGLAPAPSGATLDTYRKRAIAKLGANNIIHAAYLAGLYGLIA